MNNDKIMSNCTNNWISIYRYTNKQQWNQLLYFW